MRIGAAITKGIYLICVVIVIINGVTQLLISDTYLKLSYGHYDRHDEIEFDYDYAVENTVRFLNNKQQHFDFSSSPDVDDVLMTERGIQHMHDVKEVVNNYRKLSRGLFILILLYSGYLWKKNKLKDVLKHLYIAPIILFAFVGTFTLINFDWLFTKFHELLFDNDLWLLEWNDPLLQMVPVDFFMFSGIMICVITLTVSIVISVISRRK